MRNFQSTISAETAIFFFLDTPYFPPLTDYIGAHDVPPQLDISRKNSDHYLTPRESVSCNWQLKQVALTAYPRHLKSRTRLKGAAKLFGGSVLTSTNKFTPIRPHTATFLSFGLSFFLFLFLFFFDAIGTPSGEGKGVSAIEWFRFNLKLVTKACPKVPLKGVFSSQIFIFRWNEKCLLSVKTITTKPDSRRFVAIAVFN